MISALGLIKCRFVREKPVPCLPRNAEYMACQVVIISLCTAYRKNYYIFVLIDNEFIYMFLLFFLVLLFFFFIVCLPFVLE